MFVLFVACAGSSSSFADGPGSDPASSVRLQKLEGHRPREMAVLKSLGPVADDKIVDVSIALRAPNEEALNAFVNDVYDPASPNYHAFLTPAEFTERFAPSAKDYQAVVDFATRNKLTIVSTWSNRLHVHVRGTAAAMNSAFHVQLESFKHPTEARTFYGPDRDPSLDLQVPIKSIVGLNTLHLPRHVRQAGGSGSGGTYTGKDFRKAYAPNVSMTGTGQTVGILELDGYDPNDIATYAKLSGFSAVKLQNVYLDNFTGVGPDSVGRQEATGDIEFVLSMAPGVQQITIYGISYDNAAVLDALTEMANPSKGEPFPNQISTSFYFNYESGAVYAPLAQLAAQGQALFVASGDYGSYNESTGAGDFPPTDDPHVTAVGGTVLTTDVNGAWSSETTWSSSGGGFSPWAAGDPEFKIPSWQQGMNFAAFGGSSTARNAPDVSIIATNTSYYYKGGWSGFAGTSEAAPLWAGFLALVNQQAAMRGRPRIGSPNSAIYQIERSGSCATCFHDITTGNNFNGTNPGKYSAVPGYDLCTGWGSPNGQDLINALVNSSVGWGVLPGGGTTNVSDAATVFQGKLYLFGIGIGDHRHYVNTFDGNQWNGWGLLPGGGTAVLSDAATVFQNKLYLFGVGINDHRHYVNMFDGASWAGWSNVPGGGTTNVADAAAVYQNKLYLFGIGINDHHHYVKTFDGTTWSAWSAVPGGGTTVLSDTATAFQNKLYLFGIGIGDHRHYVNTFNGMSWSGWSAMPGNGTTNVADVAVALGNKLYVFAIGINDHHHYVNAFDGATWGGWSQVPGGGKTLLPDAAAVFNNKVYLFGIGTNDHQHYLNIYP